MTRQIVAMHAASPLHLRHVVAEMQRRMMDCFDGGDSPRPRILGYDDGGAWQAICGSHRIAAAVALGVPVTLVWVDPDAPITVQAIREAAGELLSDLPLGITPREIVAERERVGSGVRYECEVAR